MQALTLNELKALLESADFCAWWDDYARAQQEYDAAAARLEDALSQAALMSAKADLASTKGATHHQLAADLEMRAAELHAEAAQAETKSYATVEAFEEQRNRTTAAWHRVNALESALGEQSSTKSGKVPSAAMLIEAKETYDREQKKKDDIWAEVMQLWERNLELHIDSTEKLALATRERRRAEEFSAEAKARQDRAAKFRAEGEDAREGQRTSLAKLAAKRESAQARFDCTAGNEFLFFADRDRPSHVFAVALVTDETSFGVPVRPLEVHEAERGLGVQTLRAPAHISAA